MRSSDGVLRAELNRAFGVGVDLTQIPDRHRTNPFWRDRPGLHQVPERFRICLLDGLRPDNEISGGRVLWVGTRKVNCRAATALQHGGSISAPQQIRARRFLPPHASQTGRS
jgi:hypothetical protein